MENSNPISSIEKAKILVKAFKEAEAKEKAKSSNIVNTNDVPKPLRPIDRAAAQRRKIDNAYDSYMAKKLLPSLHDDK